MEALLRSTRVVNILLLVVITIGIQGLYAAVVRPGAAAWLAEQEQIVKANPEYRPSRSLLVTIRDPEPQAAIIMAVWAIAMATQQAFVIRRYRSLFDKDLLHLAPGQIILQGDVRDYERTLDQLPGDLRDSILPRTLRAGLKRFGATGNVQDASTTIHHACESESVRLDSHLSLVRFGVWSIPAIGFVGTVRGLGEALQTAKFAFISNDPSAMTAGLGISFNSTFVALTLCIIVMFALHELQIAHDSLTLDAERYAEEKLVENLKNA